MLHCNIGLIALQLKKYATASEVASQFYYTQITKKYGEKSRVCIALPQGPPFLFGGEHTSAPPEDPCEPAPGHRDGRPAVDYACACARISGAPLESRCSPAAAHWTRRNCCCDG